MEGVVAGRIVKVRPHPRGERIWLADVDTGTGRQVQVVWGGLPVLKSGDLVPVAQPGARLPGGKVRRRRYRGEISDGMLYSPAELGWDLPVTDRVAILSDSSGLRPGDPLDDHGTRRESVITGTKS